MKSRACRVEGLQCPGKSVLSHSAHTEGKIGGGGRGKWIVGVRGPPPPTAILCDTGYRVVHIRDAIKF